MHTTEQLNTALAGRYSIERRIGEGGMAIVYLARDVKHNRRVALKVLKPDLGAIVGGERFLSEIQVTANLQHPNLLPLFDSGAADGMLFYVMPYVEGETLRHRIDRETQLPVDEAVRIAVAIAGALEYAHRHGVIHRDLKPENILLHEGQPMVADFGIALALSNAGGNRITQTGLSLGTPQYMSPEQATGDRTIDARSDIYSLGAVTYEMLTGEPPHTGASSQAIIARVLTERPRSIRVTRPNVPVHVEAALDHALEKLAADRFGSVREFADALSGAHPFMAGGASSSAPAPAPLRSRRNAIAAIPWIVGAVGVAIGAWTLATPKAAAPVPGKFRIEVPDSLDLGGAIALSHDGSQLVFGAQSPNGQQMLYLRRMGDPVAQPIRGSEDGYGPGFSPDGASLLFVTSRHALRSIPVVGGTPRDIGTDVSVGASWGERGVVYTTPAGLMMVSPDGGSRRMVLANDSLHGVFGVALPDVLPGGEFALVSWWNVSALDSARIGVVSLANGKLQDTGLRGMSPRYAAPGYVVFITMGGELYAAPFSLAKKKMTGSAVLIAHNIWLGERGGAGVTVSENGTMAQLIDMAPTGEKRELFAVDRVGKEEQLTREPLEYATPRVSPDGRRILISVDERGGPSQSSKVWIHDIAARTTTIASSDTGASRAEWTRDGSGILFRTNEGAAIWGRPANLSRPAQRLTRGKDYLEISPGPPGGLTAIRRGSAGAYNELKTDILLAPNDSLDLATPLFTQVASMVTPAVSPDGHLLAFVSNESGRLEVYVTPIPGPGPRVQVSVDGGTEPVWSRDGKSLFYRTGLVTADLMMMSAAIAQKPALTVGKRDALFADRYVRFGVHTEFDVFPDGRFAMVRSIAPHTLERSKVYVITNWTQAGEAQALGASGHR